MTAGWNASPLQTNGDTFPPSIIHFSDSASLQASLKNESSGDGLPRHHPLPNQTAKVRLFIASCWESGHVATFCRQPRYLAPPTAAWSNIGNASACRMVGSRLMWCSNSPSPRMPTPERGLPTAILAERSCVCRNASVNQESAG